MEGKCDATQDEWHHFRKKPKNPKQNKTKQFSLYKKVNIYALMDLAPRQ